MTTFTTEDRINASPPHIVDSGASVKELSANDLAKWIEDENVVDIMFTPQEHYRGLVATMLRQQQAEISLLREYVCQLESGLDSSINLNKAQAERHGNNEPVAWMHKNPDHPISKNWSQEYNIPLYTHPAKTLTDEEIEGIARANVDGHSSMEQLKWFARAILRKAQEK